MDIVDFTVTEGSPRADQPKNVSITLKPHQLASLYRMCILDRDCGMTLSGVKVRSNIAILADLPGYGKTITFLSLIESLKNTRPTWMPQVKTYITDGYGIAISRDHACESINTSLIVVPDNLVDHWTMHVDMYTELSYEVVRADSFNKILIEDYDLIICPARYYNKFTQVNCEHFWNRVAFDEADSIHIPNTEHVNSRFLWLITATFERIPSRKNKGFLRNLFKPKVYWDEPIKKYFYPVVVKGEDMFVKKSFSLIDPVVNYIDCLIPNFVTAVCNHINSHVLELISAGDINGAIAALGGNIDTDRNIIELVTRSIKNDIILIESRMVTIKQLVISDKERNDKLGRLENKLVSLKIRNESLEQSINDAVNSDCTICCDKLVHPTLVPCCNNIFCAECLLKWITDNDICPMCRGHFETSGLYTITQNPEYNNYKRVVPKKTKLLALADIIKDNPNGRYIIFSGHPTIFKQIGKTLEYNCISFGILTTTTKTEQTLDNFREGRISVILLDAENNGAGLEIPQATDIILYHQMRKCLEIQAIGRAQRPGREGILRVWKLKYQHEYTDFEAAS